MTLAFLRLTGDQARVWTYRIQSDSLQAIAVGEEPGLDRLGRYLAYPPDVPVGSLSIVDLAGGGSVLLPQLADNFGKVQINDTSVAFLSEGKYGDSVNNPPETFQVFVVDRATQTLHQISKAPPHVLPDDYIFGVQSLALAGRSNIAAYVARPVGGAPPQVFLSDLSSGTIRQVTSEKSGCLDVTISGDGTKVACDSGKLIVIDTTSGASTVVLPDTSDTGFGSTPKLSGDGHHVAFVSSLDLDPRHLNSDGDSEVYTEDLETGQIVQVTDTTNALANPTLWAVSDDGATIVADLYGPQRANGLWPTNIRAIRQVSAANQPPTVSAPADVQAVLGATTIIPVTAEDPDGDRVQLYVNRSDRRPPNNPPGIGQTLLTDHGDGTGTVQITPAGSREAAYTFQIAAFDVHGAVAVQEVSLHTVLCPGDCTVSGAVSVDDLVHLVRIALNDEDIGQCAAGDLNGDGRITIDELLAAVNASLNGCGRG